MHGALVGSIAKQRDEQQGMIDEQLAWYRHSIEPRQNETCGANSGFLLDRDGGCTPADLAMGARQQHVCRQPGMVWWQGNQVGTVQQEWGVGRHPQTWNE
jgi:hypothetical protein